MYIKTGNYPFSYNPFDLMHYDTILNSGSFNSLSTTNNNLLLENGEILNNNIYVCFAQDVLISKANGNLNDDYLSVDYSAERVAGSGRFSVAAVGTEVSGRAIYFAGARGGRARA